MKTEQSKVAYIKQRKGTYMMKALGFILLLPFIFLLLIMQLIWIPFILLLVPVAIPVVIGLALYTGESLSSVMESFTFIAFVPMYVIKLMLEYN